MTLSFARRAAALVLACLMCVVLVAPSAVSGFTVYVPAKDKQCFFDHVYKSDKVVGSYFVAEGGNLDIDLKVLGPDGRVIYEKERTQDGSFQFKAMAEGLHSLCFDNAMSTVSGKLISFHLYVGDALHKRDAASAKSLTPLESAIVKTAEGMFAMKDAIAYSKMREERHALTVDSTNGRVIFWSTINCSAVVLMAALQVWLIRGLFEKTRRA